jgi:hypothetical protein
MFVPFDGVAPHQLRPRREVHFSCEGRPVRERTSSCPANWRAGSPKTKAFLLREESGRSTSSRNWSVARVISALTLRQYESALSQINKGMESLRRFLLLRELGGEIRRMGWALARQTLLGFPSAQPLGQRPQVH